MAASELRLPPTVQWAAFGRELRYRPCGWTPKAHRMDRREVSRCPACARHVWVTGFAEVMDAHGCIGDGHTAEETRVIYRRVEDGLVERYPWVARAQLRQWAMEWLRGVGSDVGTRLGA